MFLANIPNEATAICGTSLGAHPAFDSNGGILLKLYFDPNIRVLLMILTKVSMRPMGEALS